MSELGLWQIFLTVVVICFLAAVWPGLGRVLSVPGKILQGEDDLTQNAADSISQSIGNVTVGEYSDVKVGIFQNLGDESRISASNQGRIGSLADHDCPDEQRRKIQKWLAPWVFDDYTDSQPSIWRQHHRTWVAGSGMCLLENALPEWANSDQSFLWISGGGLFEIFAIYSYYFIGC